MTKILSMHLIVPHNQYLNSTKLFVTSYKCLLPLLLLYAQFDQYVHNIIKIYTYSVCHCIEVLSIMESSFYHMQQ